MSETWQGVKNRACECVKESIHLNIRRKIARKAGSLWYGLSYRIKMEASWGIPVFGFYEVLNDECGWFGALKSYLRKADLAFQGSSEGYEDSTGYSPTKCTMETSE